MTTLARPMLSAAMLLALLAPTGRARAQNPLTGRVVDAATHSPISGAVVLLAPAGGAAPRMTRTDVEGRWAFDSVAAGSYEVQARLPGYAPRSRRVERRENGDTTAVDLALTPAPVQLDALVVAASRRPQPLKDTPVATQLITQEEVQRTGAADLASVLDQQVGTVPQSGIPTGSGILLEGMGEQRVLVLLDGQPLVGRLSGTFDFSRIPTSIIQSVEVVEGPQSVLYGSDAMGGVVNIVTRPAASQPGAISADLVGGSQGRLDASVQGRGDAGPFTVSGDLGRREISLVPGQPGTSGAYARRWDGMGTVGWGRDSSFRLETSALVVAERQGWQSGPTSFFADNTQLAARAGATWQWGTQRLAPTLSVSEFDHLPTQSPDTGTETGSDVHEVQRLAKGQLLYTGGFGAHTVDAGLDLQREDITSARVTGGSRAQNSADPFAQVTLTAGAFKIVPGARLTWNQQWGTHWTPRLAVLYRPVPELSFRGSIGQGFRAPDFKELYIDFVNTAPGAGYAVQGNPALRPETSRNVSGSVEWAGERIYARVSGFDNRFDNFIDFLYLGMSGGLMQFTYSNVDNGHVRGVELDAGATAGALRLEGGYSLGRATQTGSGTPLLGIPAETARLGATYTLAFGLHASVTGLYTGSAPIAPSQTGPGYVTQGSFTRVNLLLSQSLPRGAQLEVGADNLLDARPANWPEASGRLVYVGVSWGVALQ